MRTLSDLFDLSIHFISYHLSLLALLMVDHTQVAETRGWEGKE